MLYLRAAEPLDALHGARRGPVDGGPVHDYGVVDVDEEGHELLAREVVEGRLLELGGRVDVVQEQRVLSHAFVVDPEAIRGEELVVEAHDELPQVRSHLGYARGSSKQGQTRVQKLQGGEGGEERGRRGEERRGEERRGGRERGKGGGERGKGKGGEERGRGRGRKPGGEGEGESHCLLEPHLPRGPTLDVPSDVRIERLPHRRLHGVHSELQEGSLATV